MFASSSMSLGVEHQRIIGHLAEQAGQIKATCSSRIFISCNCQCLWQPWSPRRKPPKLVGDNVAGQWSAPEEAVLLFYTYEIRQKFEVMWSHGSSGKHVEEDERRKRVQNRLNYGNLVSGINRKQMRIKQKTMEDQARAMESIGGSKPAARAGGGAGAEQPPVEKNTLRRIDSSFARVSDVRGGCCDACSQEESELDAKEERAEVLIRSQTMPLPVDESTLSTHPHNMPLHQPLAANKRQGEAETDTEDKLAELVPYGMQAQSRATERWMRLGSTVSSLFRARRTIDVEESPAAQTRRLREHRELLEAFTRPFLYEPTSRDLPTIGGQDTAENES